MSAVSDPTLYCTKITLDDTVSLLSTVYCTMRYLFQFPALHPASGSPMLPGQQPPCSGPRPGSLTE